MCKQGKPLSELINERIKLYPASGEINRRVNNPQEVLKNVEQHFVNKSTSVDWTDGLSLEFDKWRFNLRMSNTEPVIRLHVEEKKCIRLNEPKYK